MSTMDALSRVIGEFRKLDINMPIHQAYLFCLVAAETDEEINISTLADKSGQSLGSTSRNILQLTKVPKAGVEGHDLVFTSVDPLDRRKKMVGLTPRGKLFAKELREIIRSSIN